jgi:hypothetical protein
MIFVGFPLVAHQWRKVRHVFLPNILMIRARPGEPPVPQEG